MEEEPVMEGWGLSWRGGVGHIQGWCGVCHEEVGWGCHAGVGCGVCHEGVGWGVSCRCGVGCVMKEWGGVVLQGWGESCRGGVGDEEIGWVMKGWIGLCIIS